MKTIAPKQQFLASPEASLFADALPHLRPALEAALAQFVAEQPPTSDLTAAAAAHIALEGAKRYAHILLNFADAGEQRAPESTGLDYARPVRTPPAQRAIVRPSTDRPVHSK